MILQDSIAVLLSQSICTICTADPQLCSRIICVTEAHYRAPNHVIPRVPSPLICTFHWLPHRLQTRSAMPNHSSPSSSLLPHRRITALPIASPSSYFSPYVNSLTAIFFSSLPQCAAPSYCFTHHSSPTVNILLLFPSAQPFSLHSCRNAHLSSKKTPMSQVIAMHYGKVVPIISYKTQHTNSLTQMSIHDVCKICTGVHESVTTHLDIASFANCVKYVRAVQPCKTYIARVTPNNTKLYSYAICAGPCHAATLSLICFANQHMCAAAEIYVCVSLLQTR